VELKDGVSIAVFGQQHLSKKSMHDVRCAIVLCVVCGANLCIICGHHSRDNPSTTHVQGPQGLQVQQGHEVASKNALLRNLKHANLPTLASRKE